MNLDLSNYYMYRCDIEVESTQLYGIERSDNLEIIFNGLLFFASLSKDNYNSFIQISIGIQKSSLVLIQSTVYSICSNQCHLLFPILWKNNTRAKCTAI